MIETGEIIAVNGKRNTATVRFERKSACDKCGMCMMSKKDKFVRCIIENRLSADVGDTVTVEMGERFVLTAAFVVYIIPLVLMLAALLATMYAGIYWQIGSAVLALAAGAGIAVFVDRKVKKKKGFKPEMKEIVNPKPKEDGDNE